MSSRHDVFWVGFFGIAPDDLLSPGVSIVPHVGLSDFRGVWFFLRGPRLVVSAQEPWLEHLRSELSDAIAELPSRATLSRLFGSHLDRCVGPAFQGALDASTFRPVDSTGVRRLTRRDAAALAAFRAACSPEDWDESGHDRSPLYRAAHFQDGHVTAMAGFRPRGQGVGDPCVLTRPEHRGRGLGKRVVSAVVDAALSEGQVVLYQTLEANLPAVGLALSLGYERYANHLAVRLSSDRPST